MVYIYGKRWFKELFRSTFEPWKTFSLLPMPLLGLQTDGVIFPLFPTGLAPDIPEDLYQLIKKVRFIYPNSILKAHPICLE